MDRYPRSRKETTDPPSIEEVSEALQVHWGCKALEIHQAQSRRVYYVDWPGRKVMFRANPGWDGPTPPPMIVTYVDHLSKLNAPAPEIIPTESGELHTQLRDHTLSVESRLPGEAMGQNPLRFLRFVGQRLAQLHLAAEAFPEYPSQMWPAGKYVQAMFERSLSRTLEKDELHTIEELLRNVERDFSKILDLEVLWILCRGDLASCNALATEDGEIWFVDFDSAEYAPALFDLVMTRFQWSRQHMVLSGAADILRGYHTKRPLCESEVSAFPVIWAAYYTDRITFLLNRRRNQKGQWAEESASKFRKWVLKLTTETIVTGQDLLEIAKLK